MWKKRNFMGRSAFTFLQWVKPSSLLLTIVALSAVTTVMASPTIRKDLARTLLSVQSRDHGSLVRGGNVPSLTLPGYESARAYCPPKEGAKFSYSYSWKKLREKGAQLCGIGLAVCIPVVSSDTPNNEERAIIHRALNTKLEPTEGLWREVGLILDELLPTRVVRSVDFDLWNSRFPVSRQRNQKRALDEFTNCPDIGKLRQECIRKAFIKREKLLKSTPLGVEDFDPRVIQGVGDLANALLGPWMYSFGKHLASTWSTSNKVTYASGLNAEGIGQWMKLAEEQGYTCFLETDYSRYDASISVPALKEEYAVNVRMGAPKWSRLVLVEQQVVHGRSSHGHTYLVKGTRCSGDPNTSPGNSTLNAGALAWALKKLGVDDYKVIVLGDDSVVALRHPVNPEKFIELLGKLGFNAKTKFVDDPDLVEFCSGRFWRTAGDRVWGPKVGRTLAKVGFSVNAQHKPEAWLKGVMQGMVQDCAHVPLLNIYVTHTLGLLKNVNAKTICDTHKFHVGSCHKATAATYDQFYKIYNLQPKDLDTLKAEVTAIKELPALLDHPLFEALVTVDV